MFDTVNGKVSKSKYVAISSYSEPSIILRLPKSSSKREETIILSPIVPMMESDSVEQLIERTITALHSKVKECSEGRVLIEF